jgi:hypothetical protein
MNVVQVLKVLLLAALAFDLARILITHDGVGPVEWIVGLVAIAVLVAGVIRVSRQSLRAT